MSIKTYIISAAFLFFATPVFAQDWTPVSRVKPGTQIYLTQRNGSEYKGRIVAVADSHIELRVRDRNVSIGRDQVLTIHLARRGSILKRTLIGAAAGAGIGMGVGAAVVASTKSDGLVAAGSFLYGIPIGAVVGAATTGHKKGRLIYSY